MQNGQDPFAASHKARKPNPQTIILPSILDSVHVQDKRSDVRCRIGQLQRMLQRRPWQLGCRMTATQALNAMFAEVVSEHVVRRRYRDTAYVANAVAPTMKRNRNFIVVRIHSQFRHAIEVFAVVPAGLSGLHRQLLDFAASSCLIPLHPILTHCAHPPHPSPPTPPQLTVPLQPNMQGCKRESR